MAGKIDAILKLGITLAFLIASSGVGYYYGIYLPARDARLDTQRHQAELDKDAARAAAQTRYQECLAVAQANYVGDWASACKLNAATIQKSYSDCLAMGVGKAVCEARWHGANANANCALPVARANELGAQLTADKDRCLKEYTAGIKE